MNGPSSDRPDAASPRWRVTSASRLGSLHARDHRPLQDAARTWADEHAAAVAVADGHGHRLHFRSDVGATLATACALAVATEAVRSWPDVATARAGLPGAAARVVADWVRAVEAHVAAVPFAPGDAVDTTTTTGRLRPYGTTLLVAVATERFVAVFQVGDGDIVVVRHRGEALRPLPDDPEGDGVHTASLCQPDPLRSLRHTVLDLADDDVALVYLNTDGFSGPQLDADWWRDTGARLVELAEQQGFDRLAEELPGWLVEPALVGGDDTTMALVVRARP